MITTTYYCDRCKERIEANLVSMSIETEAPCRRPGSSTWRRGGHGLDLLAGTASRR